MSTELASKLSKIENLLIDRGLDALLIQRVSNFAWVTGGASSYVNVADELSTASILITPDSRYLITNNIEAPRFLGEGWPEEQGWQIKIGPWYEPEDEVNRLSRGVRLGTDGFNPGGIDVNQELIRLRMDLLPEEQARFRQVCEGCAQAMDAAIRQVRPGFTEYEIAAILAKETLQRGILPIVNLIATDERIYALRHPLPTEKQLDCYAMLVLCGRQSGLVCSITRLAHFGPTADELRRKAAAVAEIDAVFIAATRPGRQVRDIFRQAQEKYAVLGFEDEWQLHHQGGPAGYMPREDLATPGSELVVSEGQVYAWNPSITGTKSEDTILVHSDGNEILTEIPGWPVLEIEADGRVIARPAILEAE